MLHGQVVVLTVVLIAQRADCPRQPLDVLLTGIEAARDAIERRVGGVPDDDPLAGQAQCQLLGRNTC